MECKNEFPIGCNAACREKCNTVDKFGVRKNIILKLIFPYFLLNSKSLRIKSYLIIGI